MPLSAEGKVRSRAGIKHDGNDAFANKVKKGRAKAKVAKASRKKNRKKK